MAMVAAAVANGGRLMVPHLTERIVNADGQRRADRAPSTAVVMKPSTAAAVGGMMEDVVKDGTGEPARLPGITVAGKTGTAETQSGRSINKVWFIAYAPAADPHIAVAVTIRTARATAAPSPRRSPAE